MAKVSRDYMAMYGARIYVAQHLLCDTYFMAYLCGGGGVLFCARVLGTICLAQRAAKISKSDLTNTQLY